MAPRTKREFWVLYHLYRMRVIQKCDLSLLRGEKDDDYMQKVIKKCVKEGKIGTTVYHESDCCFITAEGAEALCEMAKYMRYHNTFMDEFAEFYGANEPSEGWSPRELNAPKPLRNETKNNRERLAKGEHGVKFRAQLRKNGASHIMASADAIVYEESKPDFDTFLKILSSPNYKETFLWKLICEHGIYYTADEMRSENRKMSSRFTGVLYTEHGWYFVYNMLERISVWIPTTEKESYTNFRDAIGQTIPYGTQVAASIVLSRGRSMVTTMVRGYKTGVKKVEKPGFVEKKLEQKNAKYMNADNMRAMFQKLYLVETNSRGLQSLYWFIHASPEKAENEYEILARDNPQKFEWVETIDGRVLYERNSGQKVLIQHIYDLFKLQDLRNSAETIFVLGYEWQAQATSMALAKSFGQFVSIQTGKLVKTAKYDTNRKKAEE